MQFKSLDATMTCRNRTTGQRESLTYRCGDLDRMVPQLMGVSKASQLTPGICALRPQRQRLHAYGEGPCAAVRAGRRTRRALARAKSPSRCGVAAVHIL
jgi:hypothetical protein